MISKSVWGMTGVALVGALSLTVSAQAADLGRAERYEGGYKDGPVYSSKWDGFYLGAHIGGAWSTVDVTDLDGDSGPKGNQFSMENSGVFGGATLGYNFQRGAWLLGVEGDVGGMDLAGSELHPNKDDTWVRAKGGVYGDVTGRVGFAADRALFYAKGGVAFFDARIDEYDNLRVTDQSNTTDLYTGWTVGGGLEYLVTPNWSLKAEYQHFDFGTEQVQFVNNGARWDNDLTVDTVKVGVNYHLRGGHDPLK